MASTLGFSISLSEGTVQEYFETMYKDTTDYFTVQNSCVPNNKELIQSGRNHQRFKLRRVGDQLYLHPVGAYGQSC